MNHVVAYELITSELDAYRAIPHEELSQLVGERVSRLVHKDGVDYDLATTVRWRFEVGGDIRVRVFIGEANWGGPHDSIDDTIVIPRETT